jgi:lipopolysaccharide export LptBFGC system permease protein LptF
MARVQANITSLKAEKLWELIPKMSKSKAIEQGIILLAQDKKLASIFFDDIDAIENILNGVMAKEKQKKSTTTDKQIETAWG